jgi:AraC-like DNA-binding protein
MVGSIAKTTPELFELPEVVRALEQQLIYALVRCVSDGMVSPLRSGNLRHKVIVARFEDFMGANPNSPLYLSDVCAAIGASERTLRIACEEHLGMGPIRYLTLRRMHLVRRALARTAPSTATVTQVATDHGFWELGRFAVAYREMFGELPSVTGGENSNPCQQVSRRVFQLCIETSPDHFLSGCPGSDRKGDDRGPCDELHRDVRSFHDPSAFIAPSPTQSATGSA